MAQRAHLQAGPSTTSASKLGADSAHRRHPTAGFAGDTDYGPPGQVIDVAAGKSICFEGDPADHYYRVKSGAVCGQRFFVNGCRQMTALFNAGAYFGLANGDAYAYSADAIRASTLIQYRREDLKVWMADHPDRTGWLLDAVNREATAISLRSMIVGCHAPLERFATFLLMLDADQQGDSEIQLHLTREEIGDYLGLCMETVSRCVSRLRARGVIHAPAPHRLVIKDPNALSALANRDILENA